VLIFQAGAIFNACRLARFPGMNRRGCWLNAPELRLAKPSNISVGLLEDVSLAVILTGNLMREARMTPEETLNALGSIAVGGIDPFAIALDRAYSLVFNKLDKVEQKILSAAAIAPGVSISPDWFNLLLGANVAASVERLKSLGLFSEDNTRLRLPPGLRQTARRRALFDEGTIFPQMIVYLLTNANRGQEFLADELGNFLGALEWAVRTGRSTDVVALGRTLDPFLCLHGLWDVWGRVLDSVLHAAARMGNRAVEAWALHQSGTRLVGLNDISQAAERYRRALELRQKLGDSAGAAQTRHNLEVLFPVTQPLRPVPRFSLAGKILLGVLGLLLAALVLAWILSYSLSLLPTD